MFFLLTQRSRMQKMSQIREKLRALEGHKHTHTYPNSFIYIITSRSTRQGSGYYKTRRSPSADSTLAERVRGGASYDCCEEENPAVLHHRGSRLRHHQRVGGGESLRGPQRGDSTWPCCFDKCVLTKLPLCIGYQGRQQAVSGLAHVKAKRQSRPADWPPASSWSLYVSCGCWPRPCHATPLLQRLWGHHR